MTLFLASVRDAGEADIALDAGADIIDAKEPSDGALGAVALDRLKAIVETVGGRKAVSATVGDLPMDAASLPAAVLERASSGVDYVKFGLFPGGDPRSSFSSLKPLTASVRLIVVLFADCLPRFDAVAEAAALGAAGIMLDTMDKARGKLADHVALPELGAFIARAKARGLLVGLAGSLKPADVPALLTLAPDLLGFRGALCQGNRDARLDPVSCAKLRRLIPRSPTRVQANFAALGAPTASLC